MSTKTAVMRSMTGGEPIGTASIRTDLIRHDQDRRDLHGLPRTVSEGATRTMSEPFTFERLTPRQREVIIRKAEGKTYGQVAYELGVTEQTVKNHLGLVYARLGAEHLIEALRILGWLRLPGESQPAGGTV